MSPLCIEVVHIYMCGDCVVCTPRLKDIILMFLFDNRHQQKQQQQTCMAFDHIGIAMAMMVIVPYTAKFS